MENWTLIFLEDIPSMLLPFEHRRPNGPAEDEGILLKLMTPLNQQLLKAVKLADELESCQTLVCKVVKGILKPEVMKIKKGREMVVEDQVQT